MQTSRVSAKQRRADACRRSLTQAFSPSLSHQRVSSDGFGRRLIFIAGRRTGGGGRKGGERETIVRLLPSTTTRRQDVCHTIAFPSTHAVPATHVLLEQRKLSTTTRTSLRMSLPLPSLLLPLCSRTPALAHELPCCCCLSSSDESPHAPLFQLSLLRRSISRLLHHSLCSLFPSRDL